MNWHYFTAESTFTKRAKFLAIAWTLLIFIACLTPGREIPHIKVPLIDKWAHFVLFGIWTFLVLLSKPEIKRKYLFKAGLAGCLFGWAIEELQGIFTCLGRSKDWVDIGADAIGAFLGVLLFYLCAHNAQRKLKKPL